MSTFKSIDPESISQRERHGYLLSAVAPRPIAFASTVDKEGNVNLSPFSFFNVFSSNPPVMIFSPARSGRDNSTKDTLDNVHEVAEVAISIVNYPIVEQMSLASTMYDKGINEFTKSGLTEAPSQRIKPPFVKEAPAAFECIVDQVISLGDNPGAGNLVICRVVMMHFNEQYLDENGKVDIPKMDLVGRMGGIWYNRASPDALFEIPKPLQTKGIGVDQLPLSVKGSSVLTGNNLGRLGNISQLPAQEVIEEIKREKEVRTLVQKGVGIEDFHTLAKNWIDANATEKGMALLLLADSLFSNENH